MEDYNKQISGIRMAMKEMKTALYAISNSETIQLDDYQKSLYMRMLCSVIQYENTPCKMQLLYLKRLHKGIQAEAPVEEYMRQALVLTDINVKEFIEYIRESRVRFYFALEGIVLNALGQSKHGGYEYLGELIELLGITKGELEHISLVAKSVLEQDSECYDRAKQIATDVTAGLFFAPYIENYYIGAIIDTDDDKYYSSPNKESISDSQLLSQYSNGRVTFKNLIIEISKDIEFFNCKDISFTNCRLSSKRRTLTFKSTGNVKFQLCEFRNFTGDVEGNVVESIEFLSCKDISFIDCKLFSFNEMNLTFKSSGSVKFQQCEFRDFNNRVMIFDEVNEVEIDGCTFEHCGWTCSDGKRGGVLEFRREFRREITASKFVFCNNTVQGCYLAAKHSSDKINGIINVTTGNGYGHNKNTKCIIKNNEFLGCEIKNSWLSSSSFAVIAGLYETDKNVTSSGNICTGNVTRLFEYRA